MSKLRLSVIALVVFVLGGVAVGGAMMWGFNEFLFHSESISRTSSEAKIRISVLNALRENKTDKAVSLLETILDFDLIGLSAIPPDRLDDETICIVQRASEYREKYPRTSNFPETDAQVSAFLQKHRSCASK